MSGSMKIAITGKGVAGHSVALLIGAWGLADNSAASSPRTSGYFSHSFEI